MVEQRRQAREALVADQLLVVDAAALLPEGDVALPRDAPQLVVDGHQGSALGAEPSFYRALPAARAPASRLGYDRGRSGRQGPCGGPLIGSQRWVALALAVPLVGAGGQAPQPPPPVIRVTLSLVQVDAVVTDKGGRHVTDLTAADFEIYEDGRRQEITHCSYVAIPGPARASAAPGGPGPPCSASADPDPAGSRAPHDRPRRRRPGPVVPEHDRSARRAPQVRRRADGAGRPRGDRPHARRHRRAPAVHRRQAAAARRDRARALQRRPEPRGRRLLRAHRRGQEPDRLQLGPARQRGRREGRGGHRGAPPVDAGHGQPLERALGGPGARRAARAESRGALLRRPAALRGRDRPARDRRPGGARPRRGRHAERAGDPLLRSAAIRGPTTRCAGWWTTPTGPRWCSTRSTLEGCRRSASRPPTT